MEEELVCELIVVDEVRDPVRCVPDLFAVDRLDAAAVQSEVVINYALDGCRIPCNRAVITLYKAVECKRLQE